MYLYQANQKSKKPTQGFIMFARKLFNICGLFMLAAWLLPTPSYAAPANASLAPMLKNVMPSVVNLRIVYPPQPVASHKENVPIIVPEQNESVGSGVIIDSEKGYIITNNHVVNNAKEIIVTLNDGQTFKAKTVGVDPESDVAVIQIDAPNLKAITLGDSDELAVGDFVVAIGNPFGLEHTVTSGIVSALGRANLGIEGYENFIQTDASINPGNSGGALVDTQGRLVGINTAILTPAQTPANIGIGLAIPINMAHSIMLQLVQFGEVRRGLLGIIAQPLTPEMAHYFNLSSIDGALIGYVAPDSLAEEVGLRPGDVVLSVNGKKIEDSLQLRNTFGLIPVDEKLSMIIMRNQRQQNLEFVMLSPEKLTTKWQAISPLFAGLQLGEFKEDLLGHGEVQGLQIYALTPDSPAASAQLIPGDIIISVNQQPVTDIISLKDAIKNSDAEKPLLLHVVRGKGALFALLR